MKDKVCIVTGANSGIGKITARELMRKGAHVVFACRNEVKGAAAVDELKRMTGSDAATLIHVDLASLASVRKFVARFCVKFDHLDVLLNNAGAYVPTRQKTEDGFEMTIGANHLAPLLLTHLLKDVLVESEAPRVINVASTAHRMARLNLDDLHSTQGYRGMRAYANSKLANILHAKALAARWAPDGITVNSLHPGVIASGFAQDEGSAFGLLVKIGTPFLSSPEKGARTSVYLASSPEVSGVSGEYFVRCKVSKPTRTAGNRELAEALHSISENLVGIGA